MKRFLTVLITAILILSIGGVSQEDAKVSITTKYLGVDKNWNTLKVLVNITISGLGHLMYIEEYYSIDSNSNPKFFSSSRYHDSNLTGNKLSFEILRPKAAKSYSLIKSVVLLDNKIVFEKWYSLKKQDKWIVDKLEKKEANVTGENKTEKMKEAFNYTSENTIPGVNNITPNTNVSEVHKTPGLGITAIAIIIFMVYIGKRHR